MLITQGTLLLNLRKLSSTSSIVGAYLCVRPLHSALVFALYKERSYPCIVGVGVLFTKQTIRGEKQIKSKYYFAYTFNLLNTDVNNSFSRMKSY